MGRVNQLWQEAREDRAAELGAAGMDEEEAWELASGARDRDAAPRKRRSAAKAVEAEGQQPGPK